MTEFDMAKEQLTNGLEQMKQTIQMAEERRRAIAMGIKLTKGPLSKEDVDDFRHSMAILTESLYQSKIAGNMFEALLDEIEEK